MSVHMIKDAFLLKCVVKAIFLGRLPCILSFKRNVVNTRVVRKSFWQVLAANERLPVWVGLLNQRRKRCREIATHHSPVFCLVSSIKRNHKVYCRILERFSRARHRTCQFLVYVSGCLGDWGLTSKFYHFQRWLSDCIQAVTCF